MLLGHSAGGLIARLYMAGAAVWGHTYDRAHQVAAVITLGTPHGSQAHHSTGWFLLDETIRVAPHVAIDATVPYLTVAGRYRKGAANASRVIRRAFHNYLYFAGRGDIWGDGVVPIECAGLEGAENLVLDGIAHSRKYGKNWYGGSASIIQKWWDAHAWSD